MKTKAKNTLTKIFGVFFRILLILIIVLTVFIIAISITARIKKELPMFFGYSFSVVVSDSMTPEINKGDMIFIKETDISSVKEGDTVVFKSLNGAIAGENVAHKAIEIGEDASGIEIITKGVNNPAVDEDKVREGNFIGKAVGQSTFLGNTVTFFGKVGNVIIFAAAFAGILFFVNRIKKTVKSVKGEKTKQ